MNLNPQIPTSIEMHSEHILHVLNQGKDIALNYLTTEYSQKQA